MEHIKWTVEEQKQVFFLDTLELQGSLHGETWWERAMSGRYN